MSKMSNTWWFNRPKRYYWHSMEVRRRQDIGRKKLYICSDWYHYLLQDTHDRKPSKRS